MSYYNYYFNSVTDENDTRFMNERTEKYFILSQNEIKFLMPGIH